MHLMMMFIMLFEIFKKSKMRKNYGHFGGKFFWKNWPLWSGPKWPKPRFSPKIEKFIFARTFLILTLFQKFEKHRTYNHRASFLTSLSRNWLNINPLKIEKALKKSRFWGGSDHTQNPRFLAKKLVFEILPYLGISKV